MKIMQKEDYAETEYRIQKTTKWPKRFPLPSIQGRTSQHPKGEEADALEDGTVAPQGEVAASLVLYPPPSSFSAVCNRQCFSGFFSSQFLIFHFYNF